MTQFSDLPPELIAHILYNISPNDLLACRLISKYFNSIIQNSILLQYHLALNSAKAENNPYSYLPSSERLKALKDSEKAWAFLRPKFTTSIKVPHNPSGIYDLTGGIYLLGNANRTQLHYIQLPSRAKEEVCWKTIDVGRMVIDLGLCVFEHDLIAVVTTTSRHDTPRTFDIELALLKFSTGQPHPEAREHRLHILISQWEKPAVMIEIVGDHLVLILYYFQNAFSPEDHVFIWEWRTGILKTHFTAPYRTYSGFIFLNEHLILLPNMHKNALDIFRIPNTSNTSTSTTVTPPLSLLLPALANGRTIGGISCRAEPNPIAQSSVQSYYERRRRTGEDESRCLEPTRGFLASAEEAICTFTVRVLGVQMGGFHFGHNFTFIVHRRALVATFEEFERSQERELASKLKIPEIPTPKLGLDNGIVDVEYPVPAVPIADDADDEIHVFPPVLLPPSDPTPTKPYKSWAPSITRWFNADGIPTRWITTTAGQRYVLIAEAESEAALGPGYPYVVLDFGNEAIQRMMTWTRETNERIARVMRRRGHMAVDAALEGLMDGLPRVAEEEEDDEGSPGDMDFGSDGWGSQDTDFMLLDHAASPPTGFDEEAAVGEEAVQIGFDEVPSSSLEVDMELSGAAVDSVPGDDPESADSSDECVSAEIIDLSSRIWCVTKSEALEPADTFAEPVLGSLPYVACASARAYPFHGVLLDEERVIGLRTDVLDRIKVVEVHYFG